MKYPVRSLTPAVFLAVLSLLALPVAAPAAPTSLQITNPTPRSGNVTFSGNIDVTGIYSSNINPSGSVFGINQKVSGWGFSVTPTGAFDYLDNKGNAIEAQGFYTYLSYHNTYLQDVSIGGGTLTAAHGQVDPLAKNSLVGRLAANLTAGFVQSIDTSPDAANLGLRSFLIQSETTAKTNLGYRLGPAYLEAGFDFQQDSYNFLRSFFGLGFAITNYRTYLVPVYAYYLLNPNLALGATYHFDYVTNFGGNRLETNNIGALALKSAPRPLFGWGNLSGLVELGLVNSSSNSVALLPPVSRSGSNNLYYSVKLNYDHRFGNVSALDFDLSGTRNMQPSVIGGLTYLTTNVNLATTYRLNALWSFQVNGGYARNAYQGVPRNDDYFTAGASITRHLGFNYWIFRGLDLTLAYSYANNSSNINGFTYNQNIVSLSGSLPFDTLLGSL